MVAKPLFSVRRTVNYEWLFFVGIACSYGLTRWKFALKAVVGHEAPQRLRITTIDLNKVEWRDGEAVALLSFGRLVQ
jgi:hypothetical protein